jgi:hypothetical protein
MPKKPDFDLGSAHRYFSAECFNRAWDLIEKPKRTAEDNQKMILLSLASLWHWTQRADCTPTNLSVGYWQASRVYALAGQIENARQYGLLCLKASQGEGVQSFYKGYAYEALARAEMVAGDREKMTEFLQQAFHFAEQVADPVEKKMLSDDLNTIQ